MSSVDPSGKEAFRRREPQERPPSSVASLVRVLDENRLKPKAKEQEVLDVATEYFLQHGYRGASINAMARSSMLRAALTTVAETILGIIATDRTQALRRLIFEEATRSPEVGRHYYKIGPEQAYSVLENVLETHPHQSDFDIPSLARHFTGLLSWRMTLERQCAVRAEPTAEEIAEIAVTLVDDFMKAFLKPK